VTKNFLPTNVVLKLSIAQESEPCVLPLHCFTNPEKGRQNRNISRAQSTLCYIKSIRIL